MGTERTSVYKMSLNLLVKGLRLSEIWWGLFSCLLREAPQPLKPLKGPPPSQRERHPPGEEKCHTPRLKFVLKSEDVLDML